MSSKTKYTSLIQSETKEGKKTKFTHCLFAINEFSASLGTTPRHIPTDFNNVMDLGKLSRDSLLHVFRAWDNDDDIPTIYLGIKGDEFD